MAVAATDLGLTDLGKGAGARGADLHTTSNPERAGDHSGFQDEAGAGVGQDEAGDAAAAAKVGRPGVLRGRRKQAALPLVAAAIEVFEVERALGARGGAHGLAVRRA